MKRSFKPGKFIAQALIGLECLFCLNYTSVSCAQCIASEPRNAATFSIDNSVGIIPINSPGNSASSDNSYATAIALVLGQQTNYLKVENFGFTIPSTAVICGIQVLVEKSYSGFLGSITDAAVRLVRGGAITGNNLASGSGWSSSDNSVTYGSASNLWGISLTPAEVNASNFGVAISVNLGGVAVLPTAKIDHIQIIVHYDNALPVELLNFNAEIDHQGVDVSWSTASEINNLEFYLERSTDGIAWETIATIPGAGTSSQVHHYEWHDAQPQFKPGDVLYYRLSQVDFDGLVSVFSPVAVTTLCINKNQVLVIFPNPASEFINIRYTSPKDYDAIINILDAEGRLIFRKHETVKKGTNDFQCNINHLAGTGNHYLVQITSDDSSLMAKFIK